MKQTLIHTKTNPAKVASPLMLAQAHVLADLAQRLRNRMKMYSAGPAATAALKREAQQAEDNAREALRGAYGY
jgi:hypothetical protein